MGFRDEVGAVLRAAGVPVAGSHPYGVVIRAAGQGVARLTFRPLVGSCMCQLAEEAADAVRAEPWDYTRGPEDMVVWRRRQQAPPESGGSIE